MLSYLGPPGSVAPIPYTLHKYAMPASITASSAMIAVRVRRAWETAGSRKAETPLLTASTPVMAVHPLAKARIRIQSVAVIAAAGWCAGGATGAGLPPARAVLATPMARTAKSETTNRYVG